MSEAREKLRNALEHGIVFFTGAGISRTSPSCIPLSRDIIRVVREVLASHTSELLGQDINIHDIQRTLERLDALPLELIIGFIARVDPIAAERLLFAAVHDTSPNRNHVAIAAAQLAHPGCVVMTLNFDQLHEAALADTFGVEADVLIDAGHYRATIATPIAGRPQVCHLHGVVSSDGESRSLVATIQGVGTGLPREREAAMMRYLRGGSVLCVGYSNGDVDTFPLLRTTSQRVYWYSHSGRLSESLARQLAHLGDKLVMITRNEGESEFADVLCEVSPNVKRMVSALESREFSLSRSLDDRLDEVRATLVHLLGTNKQQRARASLFILAATCDEIGERPAALRLLRESAGLGNPSNTLVLAEVLLHGHILERSGRIGDAKRVYEAKRLSKGMGLPAEGASQLAMRRGSAALGIWKHNPLLLGHLLAWWQAVRDADAMQWTAAGAWKLWQLGDFCHFVAEIALVPSSRAPEIAVRRCRWLVVVCDRVAHGLFGSCRHALLVLGGKYYLRFLRYVERSGEDPFPGHTTLVVLRLLEVRAALGHPWGRRVPWAPIVASEEYYRWSGTSHGIGNAYCARGIVAMYAGRAVEALWLFAEAMSHYGSHLAGQRKARIYRVRTLAWRDESFLTAMKRRRGAVASIKSESPTGMPSRRDL